MVIVDAQFNLLMPLLIKFELLPDDYHYNINMKNPIILIVRKFLLHKIQILNSACHLVAGSFTSVAVSSCATNLIA